MAKRSAPEVNAGSMADIAFLLLIFFLVTTTIETDSGLNRKLPPIDDTKQDNVVIKEKNIFQLNVNKNNQLFLKTGGEEKVIKIKDLRKAAVAFLDNVAEQVQMHASVVKVRKIRDLQITSIKPLFRCKTIGLQSMTRI